jgi:hypothetical protein
MRQLDGDQDRYRVARSQQTSYRSNFPRLREMKAVAMLAPIEDWPLASLKENSAGGAPASK